MLRRVGISVMVLAAFALSACDSSGDKSDDKPAPGLPSSSTVSYEKKEIKETPCGLDNAFVVDYAKPRKIRVRKVNGTLSLRLSISPNAGCDRFFWARFQPVKNGVDASKGAFTVLVHTSPKGVFYSQASAPNPTVDAITRGTYGTEQAKIEACLTVGRLRPVCIGGDLV